MHTVPIKNIKLGGDVRQTGDPYKGKTFEGLVESVRVNGILQPLLVRPDKKAPEGETYHLVCGFRRYYAARDAGLSAVPVHIRNLSDDAARVARVVENLQREDVHPLDEADVISEMSTEGTTWDVIASRIGKSVSYTIQHATLSHLDETLARWFRENRMGVGDAIQCARLMPDIQKDIVKEIRQTMGRNPTRITVDWLIRKRHLSLGDAPFDTLDAELVPPAGSCKTCMKRTGNQRALFDDVKERDVCTDATCYEGKVTAHWKIYAKEMRAAGAAVLSKDAAKGMFVGGVLTDKNLVDLDSPVWIGNTKADPKKLLSHKPEELTVGLIDGTIRRLVPRKLVVKAYRERHPKKDEAPNPATAERKARRLANEQNRALHASTVDKIASGFTNVTISEDMWKPLWFLTVLHAKSHRGVLALLGNGNEPDFDKFTDGDGFLDAEKIVIELLPSPWAFGDLLALHLRIAQQISSGDPGCRLEPDRDVVWAAKWAGVDVFNVQSEVVTRLAPKPRGKKKTPAPEAVQ